MIASTAAWHVAKEDPITLLDSEPEPDCSLIRGQMRDYANRKPFPGEVGLVIEVSDSSLSYDRNVKRYIYAENKIPEYWIVNIPECKIEVYSQPFDKRGQSDYRQHTIYVADESISVVLDGLDGEEFGRINVSDILPFD